MDATPEKKAEKELLEAVAAKAPKGPGEAGCRTLDDPIHRRWKMAVHDAPVVAK